MKIALLTKQDKPTVSEAIEYLRRNFRDTLVFKGRRGGSFPEEIYPERFDVLVSFLSPWIIPKRVLGRTKFYNINFHPGPPEYPGTGCFNFAIYNEEKSYGVTAHLMDAKVDTGKIISVKRFPLLESDSVFTLSLRAYEAMLSLFYEVMDCVLKSGKLRFCGENWKKRPYTRKELEALCRIDVGMSKREMEKRIRATFYPGMPGAYINILGRRFEHNAQEACRNNYG